MEFIYAILNNIAICYTVFNTLLPGFIMAAAPPAVPSCIYDAPIALADLQHEGFCFPPSHFQHKRKGYYKVNDEYFDTMQPFEQFFPEKHYKNQDALSRFIADANNPAKLFPITDAITTMSIISQYPGMECHNFRTSSSFRMFCSQDLESDIRMKLFCAYGMLNNFVNHSKVELLVRGGMALRL